MPPPAATCNRCRQVSAAEGDAWCVACSAWEALGRELGGHWDSVGCRVVAADLITNTVRQVRALRALGAGLRRAPLDAGISRAYSAREDPREKREGPSRGEEIGLRDLPRKLSIPPPPPPVTKKESEEEEAEDSDEEESEEEVPTTSHRSLGSGDHRPPDPEGEGDRRSRRRDRLAGESRASHRREPRRERKENRSERDRTRSGKVRRGGRKHQKLARLATEPTKVIHRKPAADFWELSSLTGGRQHLDRPVF